MAVEWRRFLALQVLVWTTYGVVHFAASIPAILPDERLVIGLAKTVRALTGLLISSVLAPLLDLRINSGQRRWWAVYALAAIAAGFAWTLVDRAVFVSIAAMFKVTVPWGRFIHGMDLDYLFVMLAWTACYVAFALFRHNDAQQKELLERRVETQSARLDLLAAQLNPHFLFNSLNTIRSLAAEDPDRTRELITRLSSFLRRVLSFDPSTPVPLAQEIELAKDYLAVEQARFESDLEITLNVAPSRTSVVVPPLILQPLLENAVRHGEPDADGIRRILVEARETRAQVHITVTNTGSLATGSVSRGIGLGLTRSRLEGMFGRTDLFQISSANGQVVAAVLIPVMPNG